MDYLFDVLTKPWFGTLVGFLGILLAIFFYIRGKTVRRLTAQTGGIHLIGREDAELPPEVKVLYRDNLVPRLSRSTVVIWNAGNTIIKGTDIVDTDPLRLEFESDNGILDVQISKSTRSVNKFVAKIDPAATNRVYLTFDFLDPNDGARVELLHTSALQKPQIAGTVRGIPDGCLDWGWLSDVSEGRRRPLRRKQRLVFFCLAVILGLIAVVAGLLPDWFSHTFPILAKDCADFPTTPRTIRKFLVVFGLVWFTFYFPYPIFGSFADGTQLR